MTEATAPDSSPLYVLNVRAENFMLIEAFDAKVNAQGITIFSGANANGKTGVMTALEATLRGGAAVPEMPVRAGSDRAETEIVLGPDGVPLYTVRRVYRDGGGTDLEIRSADGAKLPTPQTLLNAMTDAATFNPVEFADPPGCRTTAAANERRLEMLLAIAPLPIDLKAHDARIDELAKERAAVAKRAKDLEAVVKDAVLTPAPDGPEEEEAELVGAIAKIEASAELQRRAAARVAEIEKEVKDAEAAIARHRAEIERLEERSKLLADEWTKHGAAAAQKPADAEPLRKDLADRRARNEARRKAVIDQARAEERAKSLQAERSRFSDLVVAIAELEKERADAIAAAKFPVRALTIDRKGNIALTIDGHVIPFSQASLAQRIKVSFAIMASRKPRLRACLIPKGNDLDHDSIAQIATIAAKFKFQVFMERIVPDDAAACIVFRAGVGTPTEAGASSGDE